MIGVHPRAETLYRSLWDAHSIGAARKHADLGAPVLGMAHERSSVERHMARCYRRPLQMGVSVVDYVFGQHVPQGLYLPEDVSTDDWSRFKMPREVFRELFIDRSYHLAELSTQTFRHLSSQRTEQTVGVRAEPALPAPQTQDRCNG